MNVLFPNQPWGVVLRPWPYGPPLRGRAPHHAPRLRPPVDPTAAPGRRCPPASGSGREAAAAPNLCFEG
jgi:hypothetical protein